MPTGMIDTVKDPKLQKIIDQIESKLEPELKGPYTTIVAGGMKLLFSDETHHLLKLGAQKTKAAGPQQLPENASSITLGVITMLHKASKGTLNVPASFAGALTIMCHVLEYLESSGETIDDAVIGETTKLTVAKMFKFYKISPEQIEKGAEYNRLKKSGKTPPEEGMPPEAGMPPEGMPPEGMPPEGMPPEGMPPEGMPPEGMPPEGMPPEGMPPEGMPPEEPPMPGGM